MAATLLTFCLPLLSAPAHAAATKHPTARHEAARHEPSRNQTAKRDTARHETTRPGNRVQAARSGRAESHAQASRAPMRAGRYAVSDAVSRKGGKYSSKATLMLAMHYSSKFSPLKNGKVLYRPRPVAVYSGISCVPYARAASGIDVKGNAADWWGNAAGLYERGNRPEPGSVMSFRATAGMRLGHVAVVTRVIDSRTVEVDHANWWGPGATKGGVSRGIPVIDVSPNNDWTAVRVGLGHTGDYGSVYPTNGFIYGRPDRGTMTASIQRARYTEEADDSLFRFRTKVITHSMR